MGTKKLDEERQTLIHLLRSGKTPCEAAQELSRSVPWCYKWKTRYEQEGWEGVRERSRAPRHVACKTPEQVRREILRIRSQLEAEAQEPDKLGYIGADAIYGRLRTSGIEPLPGVSTIERILGQAGATKPRLPKVEAEVQYPHLKATRPHQLIQMDIVPHYLTGGENITCFNSIDVVSRYPAGNQYTGKRSLDAADFLLHTWRELGFSDYLQMDNESCFSGGYKHPGVIGKVVRLALYVGVQPVFSPFYHPESNGFVERFHQDYSAFVWTKKHLENLAAVHQRSALFFPNYRRSCHHSALAGKSPLEIHRATPVRTLPANFSLPSKLPITEGQVHFLRAVDNNRNVLILNKIWSAGLGLPNQGVWATLFLAPKGATLRIFDAAPDAPKRRCLAVHPFPLKEPIVPLQAQFTPRRTGFSLRQALLRIFKRPVLAPSTMS
jgi:transposase InsO family protein